MEGSFHPTRTIQLDLTHQSTQRRDRGFLPVTEVNGGIAEVNGGIAKVNGGFTEVNGDLYRGSLLAHLSWCVHVWLRPEGA